DAVTADLDGDGKLDLVAAGADSGAVYVLLGNGDGTFKAPLAFPVQPNPASGSGVGLEVGGLTVVDFAGPPPAGSPWEGYGPADGRLDLVVTIAPSGGSGDAQVVLLPGLVDGLGRFAGFGSPAVLADVGKAGQVAAGDLDGDGATDLV